MYMFWHANHGQISQGRRVSKLGMETMVSSEEKCFLCCKVMKSEKFVKKHEADKFAGQVVL